MSSASTFCLNKYRWGAEEFDVWYVISEGLIRMLVFKRALSLLLSFVLAYAPSLAFASKPRAIAKHSRFQAESTDVYNRDEAREEKRAQKKSDKQAAKQAEKRAQVAAGNAKKAQQASLKLAKAQQKKFALAEAKRPKRTGKEQYKTTAQALDSIFHHVKYKGQEYTVSQIPGANGRAKAQMIQNGDMREILVDENGNGTASRWEITKGNTRITAMNPYRGGFQNIEIEEKRAGAFVRARLSLNPDFKTYRVSSAKIVPYKTQADNEVVIGCMSQIKTSVATQASDLEGYLGDISKMTGKSSEGALTCMMNQYQGLMIDKSCSTGSFAGSADDISAALTKVFATAATPDAKPARYLQCLNQHGFAYHSAEMQGTFEKYIRESRDQKNRAGGGTVRDGDENTCSKVTEVTTTTAEGKPGPKVNLDVATQSYIRPFTCSAQGNGKDISDFQPGNTGQIIFNLNSEKTLAALKGTSPGLTSASDAYALLIVHEMLHQSHIETNEPLVRKLEHCCADPVISASTTAACGDVDKYTALAKQAQADETRNDHYIPGYAGMRDSVHDMLLGQSDAFMAEWNAAINADPDTRNAYEKFRTCDDTPDADHVACQSDFSKVLTKTTTKFMDATCPSFETAAGPGNDIDCHQMRKEVIASIKDGAKLSVQVPSNGNSTTRVLIGDGEAMKRVVIEAPDLIAPKLANRVADFTTNIDLSNSTTTGKSSKPKSATQAETANANRNSTTGNGTRVAGGPAAATPNASTNGGGTNSGADTSDIIVTGPRRTKPATTGTTTGVAPTTTGSTTGSTASPTGSTTPTTPTTPTTATTPTTTAGTDTGSNSDTPTGNRTNADDSAPTTGQTDANGQPQVTDPSAGAASGFAGAVAKPTADSVAYSSKAMPSLYTGGAASGSTVGTNRGAVDGVSQEGSSIQSATAVSRAFTTVAQGAINSIANSVAGTSLAPSVAQARMPASQPISYAQATAGYRNSGSSSQRDSSSDQESPKSAKPEKAIANEKSEDGRQAPAAEGKAELKSEAAAIQLFVDKDLKGSTDVVSSLMQFGKETSATKLETQLRDPSSLICRKLRANGWTIVPNTSVPVLKNSKGQCFRTDPKKILSPWPSCR